MELLERKLDRASLRACVWMVAGACLFPGGRVLGAGPGAQPLSRQTGGQTATAPAGWLLTGSKPESYRTGVERDAAHGEPSAYLTSAQGKPEGFGTLMQTIQAANYAGKRVRLRASVESKEVGQWAGLWMRVDRGQTIVGFDNMQRRAITGTQAWRPYDVVLDVPPDATGISFGVLLTGAGEVWMNNVTFEVVGGETEVTGSGLESRPAPSVTPVNLNFRE